MNKELGNKGTWRVVKWVVRTVEVLLVLVVLLAVFNFSIPFEFVGLLLFGWIGYLARVLPLITFNPELAVGAFIALGLALFGLHRLLRALTRREENESGKWRFIWTVKFSVMGLLLFGTALAAIGLVHQIAWLCHEPNLIENRGMSRQVWELANMKQVGLALKLYADDHNGKYPKKLDELVPDDLPDNKLLFTRGSNDDPPERITYFPGNGGGDSDGTIVLASPSSSQGPKGPRRCVVYRDGSGEIMPEYQYHELLQKQQAPGRGP